MTGNKCSLCRMITDIPPSYQENPAEMVRKHPHVNTTRRHEWHQISNPVSLAVRRKNIWAASQGREKRGTFLLIHKPAE